MRIDLHYQPGSHDLNQVKELLRQTIKSLGLKILPREIPLTRSN